MVLPLVIKRFKHWRHHNICTFWITLNLQWRYFMYSWHLHIVLGGVNWLLMKAISKKLSIKIPLILFIHHRSHLGSNIYILVEDVWCDDLILLFNHFLLLNSYFRWALQFLAFLLFKRLFCWTFNIAKLSILFNIRWMLFDIRAGLVDNDLFVCQCDSLVF